MMRAPMILTLLLTMAMLAGAQQEIGVNLCPNPGFEEPMDVEMGGDGQPVRWGTNIGKGEVEFAIVTDDPHSGERCAYIKALPPDPSGYWTSPRIPVEGGKKYEFRCWYRSRDVQPSNRGIIFSLNSRRADGSACGWPSTSADPFTQPWTEMRFTGTAAPDAAYVNLVVGLADSPGELWIDDIFFANTGETRGDVLPTDAIVTRPFPQTWMPGDRSIGLIQREVQPLLFLIQNVQSRQVDNPAIGLLLPAGIELVGGDRSVTSPTEGTPVEHEGTQYRRWLQPVEQDRHMQTSFDYYRGVLVCLRADLEPGDYRAYSFFSSDQESEEPHELTLRVLPALPQPPELARFHVGALLTDSYRAGGTALEGLADLYAHTGMNVVTWGLTPDPTELGELFKQRGVLRHFLMPGQGVVYNVAYGNRDPSIAAVSAAGEPNLSGLCPTYIAQRGEHFERACLEEIVGRWIRADVMDGFAINWEPPGAFRLEDYCWDDRCLRAFEQFSGIPFVTLKRLGPAGIIREHRLQWARFRADLEGRIAKAYYDKTRELEAEVGRPLMWYPWTGSRMFDPPDPTREQIDELIAGQSGDVEHPYYYRDWIDAYGPFTYAYYDVLAEQWRGRHSVTLQRTAEAVAFAAANAPEGEGPRPVWLGIEGIQKGSASTLCWATTPAQMEVEIIGGLAQGAEGIYVYTARGMDGHFYSALARAVRRAALLEQFIDGPVEGGAQVVDPEGNIGQQYLDLRAYARRFTVGERSLLVLLGLDFERSFALAVRVPGLAAGEYAVSDPISGETLGDGVLTADELAAGVPVSFGPGYVRTLVIERR